MAKTAGKLGQGNFDDEDDVRYLRKPQRSKSVSPELRVRPKASVNKDAGAVDEEQFQQAFNDYKVVSFSSGTELEKALMEIHGHLATGTEDWEIRVEQLKRFRGYIVAGAADQKEFMTAMRYLDLALQTSVRDLRSQVVREACIAIAFLAVTLGLRCERTAEMLLPTLISLIQSSTKVIATSGTVAIRFVLIHVHSHKLIPIITQEGYTSKSKETRRACCEFVKTCLSTFPKTVLERHLAGLRETVKKGMSDADSDTRAIARQAYGAFAVVFPTQARELFKELDLPKQRLLNDAGVGPTAPGHLPMQPTTPASFKPRPVLKSTTIDDFEAVRLPARTTPKSTFPTLNSRSISAVDATAARKARARFLPQSSQPEPVVAKTAFGRGTVTALQRSMRRDVPDKRGLNSTQKISAATAEDDEFSVTEVATNIPSIVALLGSSNWLTRRDGLINLREYFRQGKTLLPSEQELLRSSFTRLIGDPSTKMVGIVVDTLYDFIHIHNLQLGSWLYQLLVKLWMRQAADLSPVVQVKMERLLVLIREAFPASVQFQHVLHFLTETTQTTNASVKTRLAVLDYLNALIRGVPMQSEDLKNTSVTRLGVTKFITWAGDGKLPIELRQSCQSILVLLNQLNPKELVDIIDNLGEDSRNLAIKLISSYPRRPSAGSKEDLSLAARKKLDFSPGPSTSLKQFTTPSAPEGRYGFQANQKSGQAASAKDTLRQLSNDENVSPVVGSVDRRNGLPTVKIPIQRHINGVAVNGGGGVSPLPDGFQNNKEEQSRYLTSWSGTFTASSKSKQIQLLDHLHLVLPIIKEDVWEEHFMTVLPFLYDLLHNANQDASHVIAGTLICFADLLALRSDQMRQFPELTIVNLLEVQRNPSKAVANACDECLRLAIHVYPCSVIVNILSPIIAHQPAPENAAAVRFFTLMCQKTDNQGDLIPTLPVIIPLLVEAYLNCVDSTMRKDCVYGLIYAQLSVGEDLMEPYYQTLPVSKRRLLNLYLKRVVEG